MRGEEAMTSCLMDVRMSSKLFEMGWKMIDGDVEVEGGRKLETDQV